MPSPNALSIWAASTWRSGSWKGTSNPATIPELNTPFKNPIAEDAPTIEVTDPGHPLFGRTFALISVAEQPGGQHVIVFYRRGITLRISLAATNLVPKQPQVQTKLTTVALQELISTAEESEVLCPSNRKTSGQAYPQNVKSKFLPKSP
jgi:hypothetical protein